MFLLSKDGGSVIEVKQVDMRLEYDKSTKKAADEIYSGIMAKCYNYGSTENAERAAVEKVEEFLQGKNPPCKIIVNGSLNYGIYNKVQGRIVFNGIVNALKNESAYFDMREVDFGEDSQ